MSHARLVAEELPRTRKALQTMYFRPDEKSPRFLDVQVRFLYLKDIYQTFKDQYAEDLKEMRQAYRFLNYKNSLPHPCDSYYQRNNAMNRCDSQGCYRILVYIIKPQECVDAERRKGAWEPEEEKKDEPRAANTTLLTQHKPVDTVNLMPHYMMYKLSQLTMPPSMN
jgi:hypothetical protein